MSKRFERLTDSSAENEEPFSLREVLPSVTAPNLGVLPEGIYLPRSENSSPPGRSPHDGGRPPNSRCFMEIPKTDGAECLHGYERPILTGGAEKDRGS